MHPGEAVMEGGTLCKEQCLKRPTNIHSFLQRILIIAVVDGSHVIIPSITEELMF